MKLPFIVILFSVSCAWMVHAQEIISPNKKIKVVLVAAQAHDDQTTRRLSFAVYSRINGKYVEVLPGSPLGITRADQQFVTNLRLVKESKAVPIHDAYTMVTGKRSHCENRGTEKIFSFVNPDNQPVDIAMRAYNDGVAFRYTFPNQSGTDVSITSEATTYVFPDSTRRWCQSFTDAYEGFFPVSTTGTNGNKQREWGYPALFKLPGNSVWVLVSEAGITGRHCATRLCNLANPNAYVVTYPPSRKDFKQTGVVTSLPWSSPWHTLIIGELSDLVASTLITDVSAPNVLTNTEWIHPGPVSWIYWANNHGSKDYQKIAEYVDMAVEMHWPYVLIDWEWDVMTNGGTITDAVRYANSKGIKPMMWYNSGTSWLDPTPNDRMLTAEKRAKEFAWLNSIGVYGIKVDFFAGDQQDMMKYYLDILHDAANYHLMVNFHGATVPRGWARTYPNLMSMEAVYGAEWYNNAPVLTKKAAVHNTTLPFTRNVIGSMDYTPVTFSNSQHPHITSYGHELALAVVFESGLQHFADRPAAYRALPEAPKEFLKTVPVSWDQTKLLDGYPGEKVVIAREKGSRWYVGGLNGKDSSQTLAVNCAFLGTGEFEARIIKDGKDSTSFATDTKLITHGSTLTIDCLPRGGFVAIINKHNNTTKK